MQTSARETEILKILDKNYSVSIKELAKTLFASEPTIRRDLSRLEEKKLVIRTHGRVIANPIAADANIALSAREQQMYGVKRALAEAAAALVADGSVIMLDASTTASHLVRYLEKRSEIIVITSGIKTAYMLGQTNIKFICTGGEAINASYSLIGPSALHTIGTYNADICFVSCHGLSPEGHVTDTSVPENEVRRAILRQSKRKVLLLDSTKIGNGCWHNLCDVSEFDDVVCNAPLPDGLQNKVRHFILA